MAFGCDESAIDSLTGKYPVPESIELTTLAALFGPPNLMVHQQQKAEASKSRTMTEATTNSRER